jgi:hypothetical protein
VGVGKGEGEGVSERVGVRMGRTDRGVESQRNESVAQSGVSKRPAIAKPCAHSPARSHAFPFPFPRSPTPAHKRNEAGSVSFDSARLGYTAVTT